MVVLTACDVNGVPSWNLTFGRRWKVQAVPSALGSQAVARAGCASIFSFHATRWSYIESSACWNGPVPAGGSSELGSVPSTTTKLASLTALALVGADATAAGARVAVGARAGGGWVGSGADVGAGAEAGGWAAGAVGEHATSSAHPDPS